MLVDWLIFALSLCAVATFTCCCGGTCIHCTGTTATTYEVVIAGTLTDDSCPSGCSDYVGTFYLSQVSDCVFEYVPAGSFGCTTFGVSGDTITLIFSGTTVVSVTWGFTYLGNINLMTFLKDYTPDQPACILTAEDIPFDSVGSSGWCTGASGLTCTVTGT